MPWSTNGLNKRADSDAALIAQVSLHTGDPGAAGTANEWSGGGYARQAPTYAAAVAGVADLSAVLTFAGPASTAAAYIGTWDSGGGYLGGWPRTSGDAAANAAGEYEVDTLPVTASNPA